MRGRSPKGDGRETARWLTTFNDMITLLMVFFVLLFSMATTDITKLKQFQVSIMRGLGILEKGEGAAIGLIESFGDKGQYKATVKGRFIPEGEERIEDYMESLEAFNDVEFLLRGKDRVMVLDGAALFESGSADISPEAVPFLKRLYKIIDACSCPIRVEGHTDNVPISTEKFASNWELSTTRAVNIVKFFIEEGNIAPERLSAVGYGELRPLASNDTAEGRARNRRVEIVLAGSEEK